MDYNEFISGKVLTSQNDLSLQINREDLNPMLYDFQRDIVHWALIKGRAAIFADCGLGKTPMQLEWAHRVNLHTGEPVLILAPLAVAAQTKAEGDKFGIPVTICESQADVTDGINITNYEKLDKFNLGVFGGIVLDESSILKSFTGKLRNQIIEGFSATPFRLACTATPAPNDFMELGNHSEFLGVMARAEMLAMFFVHDGGETSKWRLKGHAEDMFWEWMGAWAVFLNSPADLGYQAEGFNLPDLNVRQLIADGSAVVTETMTLTQRRDARRETLEARCQAAALLANWSTEQWLIWCDLNDESARLTELIGGAVEVKGADSSKHKTEAMLAFSRGEIRCLVTKPSIAGFGMNWQQCHNMIFVGLSDSYEQYYQAMRRCWRFGQTQAVNTYVVISCKEGAVLENIQRKQADCDKMRDAMVEQTKLITKRELKTTSRITAPYIAGIPMLLPKWKEFIA